MYSRSLLLKLDKINIVTMSDAIMMREYLESFVCFIAKKIITDGGYPQMDVRYDYSAAKIDHAFNAVEHLVVIPNLRQALIGLNHILTKNIEETIHEFYMSNYAEVGSLNLNSMLMNCDTLLVTYEFFHK
ncbi:MAG: hypothetical protein HGA35_04540 [Erysipelotrichaceae bacterium]|nr:hypothetical protein [Erysipelotrichaceae bacterium]